MSLSNKSAKLSTDHSRPLLIKRWRTLFGSDPPLRIGIGLLSTIVLHANQESNHASAFRKIERQLAAATIASKDPARLSPELRVGDRIVRGWRGVNHEITILPKGFSYRGEVHRSLSEIARLITGVRWSGPRFFGIREKNL